nr:hypothetical protein [Tanacetum cinerariifolium]
AHPHRAAHYRGVYRAVGPHAGHAHHRHHHRGGENVVRAGRARRRRREGVARPPCWRAAPRRVAK